jgi:hypothetical protein
MSDTPSFTELQQMHAEALRMRDEAAADRKAAAADRETAEYERGQAARDRREIADIEKSVAKREKALKQAGEPAFLERVAAADKALAEAKALKADYDAAKHGAMLALQSIDAREKAERAAAA